MAKYRVCATVVGSTNVGEYEADSEEAAIEMAWEDVSIGLCHHCARKINDPETTEFIAELVS